MAKSALSPLAIALVAAIEGSSALAALLAGDKVYKMQVPAGSPLDYVTLESPSENDDSVFGARGTVVSLQMGIWTRNSRTIGTAKLLAIYDALYQLLHQQPLSMTGFRYVIGTLALIAIVPDPDGETLHGVLRYDITQRQSA